MHLASFPGLPRSFCSSVCVGINTRIRKSGEERGRPGIIHHVSDVRWMQGGRGGVGGGGGGGGGGVVISAGSEAVHHPVGSVRMQVEALR